MHSSDALFEEGGATTGLLLADVPGRGLRVEVAEAEAHHPDFCVHYNEVDVTLWTHTVGGLSENDFILAAKLDAALAG